MNYIPKDGFPYYFALAKRDTLKSIFKEMLTLNKPQGVSKEKAKFRYEPNKWSIKQVVGHITDHERIKMYRAFELSRNENVQLWGYDQEFLVRNSRFDELSMPLLLADFLNVRKGSLSFIDTLPPSQLQRKGKARRYEITLEEFLRSIIGHEHHHVHIIQEKYQV